MSNGLADDTGKRRWGGASDPAPAGAPPDGRALFVAHRAGVAYAAASEARRWLTSLLARFDAI